MVSKKREAQMASLVFGLVHDIFLHFLLVKGQCPLAPALYVFGDSLSDSGNNNFLETIVKVNYTPYGIDFPAGATGRFNNGKTMVDFIAESLGLPLVPAYLSLSTADKNNITTGLNYASAAAGILPESGTVIGDNLSLDEQVEYFKVTIRTHLRRSYRNPIERARYLSKSIFFISIGNNDYINNYLQPDNYRSSQIYTPQQFADRLLSHLTLRITNLYLYGARKFVVFNIIRLGCLPAVVDTANPRPTTPCVEDINNLILLYNTKFPRVITSLERTLLGSTFICGDAYNVGRNSSEAGFTAAQTPCCQVSTITGQCIPESTPCQDRTQFIFWDGLHTTEVVNNVMAGDCFNGNSSCVPINIQQLVQKQ
ncbi:hypothetical protein AQUCO_00200962v1 [Aquilegia coerulea]|uniref:SGNH hydrolase-type esterase domain-containing protein n=1 Tax=Aquilegia coerulea TaxID=218851 RepID=A0A2G5F5J6_AQUCA|nr:hypothetical protein AQUCO_00200962v1 [Aquilegia coerulea]